MGATADRVKFADTQTVAFTVKPGIDGTRTVSAVASVIGGVTGLDNESVSSILVAGGLPGSTHFTSAGLPAGWAATGGAATQLLVAESVLSAQGAPIGFNGGTRVDHAFAPAGAFRVEARVKSAGCNVGLRLGIDIPSHPVGLGTIAILERANDFFALADDGTGGQPFSNGGFFDPGRGWNFVAIYGDNSTGNFHVAVSPDRATWVDLNSATLAGWKASRLQVHFDSGWGACDFVDIVS